MTGWLDLGGYPPGTQVICRRERPHPGARPRFTDAHGRRYHVMLTDQADHNLARLELRHRQHDRIQVRTRVAKATGLANLPFGAWRRNAVWLELVSCAQDLTCWRQSLLLEANWPWPSPSGCAPHRCTPPAGCLPTPAG